MALIYFEEPANGANIAFDVAMDSLSFAHLEGVDGGDIRLARVDADGDSSVDDLRITMPAGALAGRSLDLLDVAPEDLTHSDFEWSASGFVMVGDNDPADDDGDSDGGDNDIFGTNVGDYLMGLGGNDTITALAGDDVIDLSAPPGGGYGHDVIDGGDGTDLLFLGRMTSGVTVNLGTNVVTGGASASSATLASIENVTGSGYGDKLTGSAGINRLGGEGGNDTINGGGGNDILNGDAGVDKLNGGTGNDVLDGGAGADNAAGGDGNDTIVWGTGDTANGGIGTDTLKLAISLNLSSSALTNKITDTEIIDMTGGGGDTLALGRADVLELSSTINTIKILGDSTDTVNILGALPTPTVSGAFLRYALGGGAVLLIDQDINVI